MKILACDTSTLLGSVAISDGPRMLASRSIQRAGSHSDTLNGMITECLQESNLQLKDIDVFATGLGPGSFTGIRISLNTIKTLAYVYNKPVVGLDSLFMMAEQAQHQAEFITPMINAFKNMVYIAEYQSISEHDGKKIITVKAPQVVRVQDLKIFLNPKSLVLGDGYVAYESYLKDSVPFNIIRDERNLDSPLANTMCQVFGHKKIADLQQNQHHWSTLLPLYLRASEAEENLNGIKYMPL